EVSVAGRPYLLDRGTGRVFRDVAGGTGAEPEPCGQWVGNRVVFTPAVTEAELYSALATYLEGPLQPAPQPQRTAVQLCQWGTAPGPVQGAAPQPLLLLDAASGLVFQAPPKLLQARQAQEQAKLAPPLPQHWRPIGSAHYTFSGSQQLGQALQQRSPKFDGAALVPALEATPYTRPGRRTGALQAAGPMPYPRLVGRLHPPDNRLLPAPLPALHQLFSVLLGVAAEPYQMQTLFKVHDRSGNGLGLLELQELLHRMPGAGTPVVTSTG
ncbi:uncharacterized protein HaLaN_24122, partial [Haematococcus lacustris]